MQRPVSGRVLLLETEFPASPSPESLLSRLPADERPLWADELGGAPAQAALRLARTLWLREVLALFTGLPPSGLALTRGRYGKPVLRQRSLHFNTSHSGRYSLLALSPWPVGIDVEKQDARRRFREVAELWFHPQEKEHLATLSDRQALATFFCLWTRKEALAKAQGQAVSRVLAPKNLLWPPGLRRDARRQYWFLDLVRGPWNICLCSRIKPEPLWWRQR